MINIFLTVESMAVFLHHAKDAVNWNGTPMLDITKNQRGNITDLKSKGLIATFRDEGCDWVMFTDAGKELAKSNGITIK